MHAYEAGVASRARSVFLAEEQQHHAYPICFGPFRLFPAARLLEKDGKPLPLGNRALDILMVLVERAGEVVDQRELLSRVWRGLVVSPGNLRVHMSALRKALNDYGGGARYIANVTGQGYCFVAPIGQGDGCASPDVAVTFSDTGAAIERLLALGASVRDIRLVQRHAAYQAVFLCR